MCGIFGLVNYKIEYNPVYNKILGHRGPDGSGYYTNKKNVNFYHTRLKIIGLDKNSGQPMKGRNGNVIIFNGEIYNYKDLKKNELKEFKFMSNSDTEVILKLYEKFGIDCLDYLRGMFAFAIWDENKQLLFCARDRFGIKPFYYFADKNRLAFASEIKALMLLNNKMEIDNSSLYEYLKLQFPMGSKTLFKNIAQLMPGECLIFKNGNINLKKYWRQEYNIDFSRTTNFYENRIRELFEESIKYHLVSDVKIGSYLSGGIDSSLVTILASKNNLGFYGSFHGYFKKNQIYNENLYAKAVSEKINKKLFKIDIKPQDFIDNISKIIYYLDFPVAGPGAFSQFMVSKLASNHVKVILGGQGGDEIFGGYARYIIAYFSQCINAAIDGTHEDGNFVVSPESIIPNLKYLKNYKPLIQSAWNKDLFSDQALGYLNLIDRSNDIEDEVNFSLFDNKSFIEKFKETFNKQIDNKKVSYFDKMTRFDFNYLLPALLQVEDRMSMANGLETRVPFLDHKLIEFTNTIPADKKFLGGKLKNLLKNSFNKTLPNKILKRTDKMGFPVPLQEWFTGSLRDFVFDIFSSNVAKTREFYNPRKVLKSLEKSGKFSRKVWGLLSLELWFRNFYDKSSKDYLKL